MKPFRFPLQPLRVLREQREQTAQKCYAEALRACEQAATRVRTASEGLDNAWSALQKDLRSGVTGTQLMRARAWCNVLELRLKDRTRELEQSRLSTDTFWHELMRATRDREALDSFHDRRRQAYDQEARRTEQNALDEMALQIAAATAAVCGARVYARAA